MTSHPTTDMPRRQRVLLALGLATVTLSLVLGACGGETEADDEIDAFWEPGGNFAPPSPKEEGCICLKPPGKDVWEFWAGKTGMNPGEGNYCKKKTYQESSALCTTEGICKWQHVNDPTITKHTGCKFST